MPFFFAKKFGVIKKCLYLCNVKQTKQTIMKVTTRKQLESQGIATIESNDLWGFGEGNEFKYVLVIIKEGFLLKHEKTTNYAHNTIKDCIEHYNEGFVRIDGKEVCLSNIS